MDDHRVGIALRTLRVNRRWTQSDLADRAHVSRQLVSKLERGEVESVSVGAIRRVAAAMGCRVELLPRAPGGELDRMLNAQHAAMHEAMARLMRGHDGWLILPEVSYSVWGERGVIDIVAWHARTRTLLIIELKSSLVDINDLMGSMDRRARLGPTIVADRGWKPASVATWVVIADSATNRRRLADHATTLRAAFPDDGRTMRRWLRNPAGPVHALSFLSPATGGGVRRGFRPIRQVRRGRSPAPERGSGAS